MSHRYHRPQYHHGYRRRRRRQNDRKPASTLDKALGYGLIIGIAVLGLFFAWTAYANHQKRQAILDSLPAGYHFAGCDEVREMGIAPLESYERGYSERMDGDNDGTACEPYP